MRDIDKILLFLTLVIIYSSILYMLTIKQDAEIELKVSNSLINDLTHPRIGVYNQSIPGNITWEYTDVGAYKFSNQTLNETTYIHIKAQFNILDIIKIIDVAGS